MLLNKYIFSLQIAQRFRQNSTYAIFSKFISFLLTTFSSKFVDFWHLIQPYNLIHLNKGVQYFKLKHCCLIFWVMLKSSLKFVFC